MSIGMNMVRRGIAASVLVAVALSVGRAAPPSADKLAEELPRIPAVEPKDALATFQLQRGFTLELAAHEPQVSDPVDACFDADGRMYVAEMHDYPYSPEPRPQCPEGRGKAEAGVVRLLEDRDGDGTYEHSTVFADKLSWPTSVVCYNGGIFVAAAPQILYLKDTNGDGVADVREVVYFGFSRNNVQGLVNNLKWGLDNFIHGAGGPNGGDLSRRDQHVLKLGGSQLLRINPRTETIEAAPGGSQFGHSFDDFGNTFVCNNSNHILQVVLPNQYLVRNPYLPVPAVTRSIGKEGAAAPVFRKSQAEPWRLVRTRRRASDPEFAKRAPASELVATGFFTSATGVTPYRGSAYPPEFQGNVFIGDVGGNLVHRKTLTPDGAAFVATRADEGVEFLTSTDNWFRPANFVNAPDGTLYILDMYRETIEHPFSIPEDIKKHLDLESGSDRGRIYRLVSPGMKRQTPPKLSGKTAVELVAQLESSNSWNRETAQRLLWERQDKSAVGPLQALVRKSASPLARLHALWTLQGLGALDVPTLLVGLGDADPHVRENAVRLSDPFVKDSPELLAKLLKLTHDDAYRVRWQLAFTLGESPAPEAAAGLVQLARTGSADTDMRTAVLSSVTGKEAALAVELLRDADFRRQPAGIELIGQLAGIAGARKDLAACAGILDSVSALDRSALPLQRAVLEALGGGLGRSGSSLVALLANQAVSEQTRAAVATLFTTAIATAREEETELPAREAALALLAYAPFAQARAELPAFLTPQAPQPLQLAAVKALAVHADPQVPTLLIESWANLSPSVRREVVDALLANVPRLELLFAALKAGTIKPGELERDKKQLLLNHPNPQVKAAAQKVLSGETVGNRAKVVAEYQPVLELEGDAERGKAVFVKNCSVCHQVGPLGKAVGPNLASIQNKSPGDLLITILDPNREALPAYVSYTVVTDQGRIFNGLIAAESATSITLRRAEGAEDTVLRKNVEQMVSSGVSLMPEGLEKDITPAQMADLLQFVRSIKPEPAK